jgi:hypothetical protein
MELAYNVAAMSVPFFGILLFLAQFVAREVGYAVGRHHAAGGKDDSESVSVVAGAILGLMAFVLALTLSFAHERFNERRAGTLAEANAIGTAWLRAEAIGHPRGIVIARMLEDYARTRAEFVRATSDPVELAAINARTQSLQNGIWGHFAGIARERSDTMAVAFQASLNEVFDMTTGERFAYAFRMPEQLFNLLIGMAVLGTGILGYQFGLKGNPTRILSTLLTMLWTIVMMNVLDLSAARLGGIRTSAEAYDWTIQGMGKDIAIPPMPGPK